MGVTMEKVIKATMPEIGITVEFSDNGHTCKVILKNGEVTFRL
jgi:hypothetical protein